MKLQQKYIILLLSLFISICTQAQKKKIFFDSKSNIVGVTGAYKELTAEGFTAHFFENPVDLPTVNDGEKKFDKDKWLAAFKANRTGKAILNYLFQYNGQSLSEEMLRERAWENVQLQDEERAEAAAIDKESILRDDYLPILKNNFIYLQRDCYGKTYWIIFKVVIDEKTLDMVFNSWNDMMAYEQINVDVKYVASGKFRTKNATSEDTNNRHLRSISKKVPEFTIRGQITGRNPFLTNVGRHQGIKPKDRMYIYRQAAKKDGTMYSHKVATVRVGKTEREQSYLYTIAGGQASYKKGDVAVLRQDKNYSLSFDATNFEHTYGFSFTYDKRLSFNRYGFSTYLLAQLGASAYEHITDRVYAITTNEKGTQLYNPPVVVNLGLGFGAGYTFAHLIEVVPYAMAQLDLLVMDSKDTDYNKEHAIDVKPLTSFGLRIPIGVKLNINIAHPLQLQLGAEYVINAVNFGKVFDWAAKDKDLNSPNTQSDYSYMKRDFFTPFNYKRHGFNLYAGIRLNL